MSKSSEEKTINSKSIVFTAMMSALGIVLTIISISLGPIVDPQVAFDLSHIGTYIVAFAGGPILAVIAGTIVGIIPAFRFFNIALIPGKIMTGFSVGIIYFLLNKIEFFKEKRAGKTAAIIIAGIVGYIPEMSSAPSCRNPEIGTDRTMMQNW